MDWTELYPFLFGIGLIAAVMLAYGLGLHVGKRQERVAISRKRWKQKQFLIGRHQTEREQYLEKIRFLKKELGRISQESIEGRSAAYQSFPPGMGNLVCLHRPAVQQHAFIFAGEI